VGEWKNNRKHGQGTYTYPDGGKYEGEWKDGKRTGQGTYTHSNGDKCVGENKDGNPRMVMEHTLGLVETSMLGNTRMVKKMVKEP